MKVEIDQYYEACHISSVREGCRVENNSSFTNAETTLESIATGNWISGISWSNRISVFHFRLDLALLKMQVDMRSNATNGLVQGTGHLPSSLAMKHLKCGFSCRHNSHWRQRASLSEHKFIVTSVFQGTFGTHISLYH